MSPYRSWYSQRCVSSGVCVAHLVTVLALFPRSSLAISFDEIGLQDVGTREQAVQPTNYAMTIVKKLPHVGKPWTQGLEFASDGMLVETCGDYPPGVGSSIRKLDPATGQVRQTVTDGLAGKFVEGIASMGGHWFVSTWHDSIAFEYDANLQLLGSHKYPFDGWGLATSPDGLSFLATNGTNKLLKLKKGTFELESMSNITCLGRPVQGLNELELVQSFFGGSAALLGNVMNTRIVMVLDPVSSQCMGVLDLTSLETPQPNENQGFHVANGIAFSEKRGTFFLTGKNWDWIYEVRIAASNTQGPLQTLQAHLAAVPIKK
eukprot:TRINITY_DN29578_c0_g1_i1.p1 TRINITY_DN29578_c0_g1~~TRINITY_DN29578_c0_g1_i1.p1  ORF type:complete len:326 (-),score=43.62 TRINITY_DN29578_c0_g1_i1:251-1207(-)